MSLRKKSSQLNFRSRRSRHFIYFLGINWPFIWSIGKISFIRLSIFFVCIVALYFIIITAQSPSLVCKRNVQGQGTCELNHMVLSGLASNKFPIYRFRNAEIRKISSEAVNSSDSSSCFQTVLVTVEGAYPEERKEELNFGSCDLFFGDQTTVDKINAFLRNPNQLELSVKRSSILLSSFLTILIAILAHVVLFLIISICIFLSSHLKRKSSSRFKL